MKYEFQTSSLSAMFVRMDVCMDACDVGRIECSVQFEQADFAISRLAIPHLGAVEGFEGLVRGLMKSQRRPA